MSEHIIGQQFALLVVFVAVFLIGVTAFAAGDNTNEPGIPLMDQQETVNLSTATFALGCFWGGDARYGAVEGVVRTRVGYAGGDKENPTYHNLGNHTESIQVDFNPEIVSYEELVDIFWRSHNPNSKAHSSQYANILFYHSDHQREVAERTKREVVESSNEKVYTELRRINAFYPAEAYHQKYRLRRSSRFIDILKEIYPDNEDLRDSTAAAKLNGFLAGHGTANQIKNLAGKLGLTEQARAELLARFG